MGGGQQTKNLLPHEDVVFIVNILRQGSVKWRGRSECLKKSRKKVFVRKSKKGTAVYKYHWQCATCLKWFRNEKDLEVDHIEEVGPFSGDWNDFLSRMFCDQSNLQALCVSCHQKKTNVYANQRVGWKRKTPGHT